MAIHAAAVGYLGTRRSPGRRPGQPLRDAPALTPVELVEAPPRRPPPIAAPIDAAMLEEHATAAAPGTARHAHARSAEPATPAIDITHPGAATKTHDVHDVRDIRDTRNRWLTMRGPELTGRAATAPLG